MITETLYILAVPSLTRSSAFYRDVLGFEILEMGDPGWRMFLKDSCRIMAAECPNAIDPHELGDHSYFGYLVVDNVDEYFEQVRSGGAEIVKQLQDEPWGMREFGLRTIDGHRIMFGSSIARDATESPSE